MREQSRNIFDLWRRLDLRQLAAFEAVAAAGSVARAAKELGYTQPAISHQLATLEQLLGVRLFERGSGRAGATLTPAGRLLAGHVEELESRLASARRDLEALSTGESGPLRVGAFQSVSASILPRLVKALAGSDGELSLELAERTDEAALLPLLAAGELDYAFVLLPLDDERFETVELVRDPYYLVGPAGGASRRGIRSLRELDGVPIVAPRSCRGWTMVADQVEAAGVDVKYAFRTDDDLAISGLIRSGAGVALLSGLTLAAIGDGLAGVPLDGLVQPRRIGLAWSRSRAVLPSHERFVSVVRAVSTIPAHGR